MTQEVWTWKHYDVNMRICNLEQLPHGTGSRYLEVLQSHIPNEYIAVQWRNKNIVSSKEHTLIKF
jgi:hypothetical protein